jgi:hypothetical protein
MAKKPEATATTTAAAAAAAAKIPLINVPPGGTLEVSVDVGPMTIPYTIAYDGHTVIKSLVDRREAVPLQPGDRILAWAFAHASKGWSHKVEFSVNGGPLQLLEQMSEAKKDADHSVGFALVHM